ncbi:MAG: hypothetical protein ACR2OB_13985 [Solirubrobacteraceae bacterium]
MALAMAKGTPKPTCESCFFRRQDLCALSEEEACATYRPGQGDTLEPPRQMRFVFRQERRTRTVWAFPDPAEHAAVLA